MKDREAITQKRPAATHMLSIFFLTIMGVIFKTADLINAMTKKRDDMHRFSGNAYFVLYMSLKIVELTFFMIISCLNLIGVHFYLETNSMERQFLQF